MSVKWGREKGENKHSPRKPPPRPVYLLSKMHDCPRRRETILAQGNTQQPPRGIRPAAQVAVREEVGWCVVIAAHGEEGHDEED
jgi:hypothetical protein